MKEREKIVLYRNSWYRDNKTMLHFWVNLLFEADDEGLVVTSLSSLATSLRLSIQQVRTCLANIERNKLITRRTTNEGTEITICNFDSYKANQQAKQQTNQQAVNTPSNKPKEESGPLMVPNGFSPDPTSFTPYNPPKKEMEESPITDVLGDQKRDKPASATPDLSFVLDLWNSFATRNVPKIRSLSKARKEKIKLRIKEMGGLEEARTIIAGCFQKISESDFCNGQNNRQWVATFDWFFDNEKNWLKVYEGNYDNRKPQSRIQQYADTANRFNALMDELYGPDDNGTANGAGYTPDEQ